MKIQNSHVLIKKDITSELQDEINEIIQKIHVSIESIKHPRSCDSFKLNPKPVSKTNGKSDSHPNGVQYIKNEFSEILLKNSGWKKEPKNPGSNTKYKNLLSGDSLHGWGALDFSYECKTIMDYSYTNQNLEFNKKYDFVVEWETGNVSSSHRAIDKMISTMYFSNVIGGVLIVPTAEMKKYLTDRVGNYEELEPYFPFWEIQQNNPSLEHGYLEIIGISYDELDENVPYLPKGFDGNAHLANETRELKNKKSSNENKKNKQTRII
jgi:hypothetical protein